MATAPIPESDYDDDDGDTAPDLDGAKYQDLLETALAEFDEVAVPQTEIRQAMREARRFVTIAGAMWEGPFAEQFENSPKPEVDMITRDLEKVEEDYRQNRIMVDYIPGDDADPDSAELLDGMYRADAAHFGADEAVDNAFKDALRGGLGAWRLTTDYADPYDPDSDAQRINPGVKIIDPEMSVYFYGGTRDDGKDAKSAFLISADLRTIAEKQWPGKISDFPVQNWKWGWDWYQPDLVYKAEYYKVEETDDRLLIFTQSQSGEERRFFKSEMEDGEAGKLRAMGWTRTSRPIKRRRVHKYIINGSYVLKDCGYIAGRNIPIVLIYGRVDWIDGQPRYRGYVEKKMDAQRLLNSRLSKLTETDSISPMETPIVADEQMTPAIAEEWARGNIDRHPFRRLLPLRNADGDIVSAGPIGTISPPQTPPVTAALLQFSLQILTGDQDQSEQVKSNVSAEAMDIAAGRVDAKSGIYMDNLRSAMIRAGEIYQDMAREIYYEPGRKVETLTMDNQQGTAELHQPTLDDDGVYRVRHDLSVGSFKVVASVGESSATKRRKVVNQSMEIATVAAQNPQTQGLSAAALYTAVINMDGETDDLQSYARQQAVAMGAVKPTPEEQKEIQQAQDGKAPAPADLALQAQTQKLGSEAQLNQAKVQQTLADAALKTAQKETLDKAPKVPTGLGSAPTDPALAAAGQVADMHAKLAGASLHAAQAAKLRHGMNLDGADHAHAVAKTAASFDLEHRKQDFAEQQAKRAAESGQDAA